jgi:hypothetical protein
MKETKTYLYNRDFTGLVTAKNLVGYVLDNCIFVNCILKDCILFACQIHHSTKILNCVYELGTTGIGVKRLSIVYNTYDYIAEECTRSSTPIGTKNEPLDF